MGFGVKKCSGIGINAEPLFLHHILAPLAPCQAMLFFMDSVL